MSDQVVLEQQESTQAKKPKFSINNPKTLLMVALVVLVLATFTGFISSVLSIVANGYGLFSESVTKTIMPSTLVSLAHQLAFGLFLPVCLFLLTSSTKKGKYSRIFALVGIVFVLVQVVCALIAALFVLTDGETNGLLIMAQSVTGSKMFSAFVSIFKVNYKYMEFGHIIARIFSNLLGSLSNLLLIFPNAICAFGFMKLFPAKKK